MGGLGEAIDDFFRSPTGRLAQQIALPDPGSQTMSYVNDYISENYSPAERIGNMVENIFPEDSDTTLEEPPDPQIAADAAAAEAKRKSRIRQKRIREGGRTSTQHSAVSSSPLGGTEGFESFGR